MSSDFSNEPAGQLSAESKVGLFVLAGLAVLVVSILLLGDIHFKPQNTFYAQFRNIEGINTKSPVKISGVEVGSVKEVELVDHSARVSIGLNKKIILYKNAVVRIRSTGLIGTKYLDLMPGHPVASLPEMDQRLASGDTLAGEDVLSLDELMERVAKSLDQFTGDGKLAGNLNATMANLKSITDSLNAAIGKQQTAMVNIVKNVEGFSAYAKSLAGRLDGLVAESRDEIKQAIHNLKETLEKTNEVVGKMQRGEGAIGALLTDEKVGNEIKETVTNLKQTSESAKEVLARFTKIRAFWEIQGRRDIDAGVSHADVGIRIEPRPNKFYEIKGQNLGDEKTIKASPDDYERRNTLTALIGRHWGPWTGAVGFIKSRGGVEGRLRPFQKTDVPVLNQFELIAQGFDFGRNDTIKGRVFTEPNYTAGARVKLGQYVTLGIQAEDIAETNNVNGLLNVSFEDKDFGYLLGFGSIAK